MDYTAKDLTTIRSNTGRPISVIKQALKEASTLSEAITTIMEHPPAKCQCGIPIGEPHP